MNWFNYPDAINSGAAVLLVCSFMFICYLVVQYNARHSH